MNDWISQNLKILHDIRYHKQTKRLGQAEKHLKVYKR